MILRSPYPDVRVPDVPLHRFVLARASALGEKPALIDGPTGRTLSYRQLGAAVERVAAGLAAYGFKKGDVLGLFAPNCPEFALVFHGTLAAGGVVTTVNSLSTVQDLQFQLLDAGARFLVTVAPFLDRAVPAAGLAGIERLFVLGDAPGSPGTIPMGALLGTAAPAPDISFEPGRDIAALPYSSGTTGLPKGVMLTHRNLVANLVQTAVLHAIEETDRIILVLPLFHIYGLQVVLNLGLCAGATLVTMPRFELEAFLGLIQQQRITRAFVVPPIVLALARQPLVDQYDISSVTAMMSGAAPLDAELETACARRVGCRMVQGYGLTEASPVTHANPAEPGKTKPGTVGLLLPNTECQIVDPAGGGEVARGEDGELWIRGPQVMRGYLNNPEATAAMLDQEGWLHTGDIGHADQDGYFTIVDRLKELIKYKGFQVAPAELEAVLRSHPAVADAAVIPLADDECGEVPKAFVVLRGQASPADLMAYVGERVAPYKKIRAVELIDAIPKSPSGKILRRVLREREHAVH
ncbi:MAG: 4-coumarate--CoA ligase family protein [Gemmatimonadetes bacterium]|nr:MAG: 4-coumarate--CoA ligase family protein [Gemmatimonadota bacterium]